MIKTASTAILRISVTLFPLLLVLLLVEKLSVELVSDISYCFAISQLLALLCRAGLDIYINQNHCYTVQRTDKLRILSVLLSKVIALCLLACGLLFFFFTDSRLDELGIFSFGINVSLLASLWLLLSFIQAQGYARLALIVTTLPANILILLAIYFGYSESLTMFYQSFNLILAGCLVIALLTYGLLPSPENKPPTSHYHFTGLLWLNAVAGTGVYWFIQAYLGAILSAENYVIFLSLFRFGQIPIAAIVGSGFLLQTRFSHSKTFQPEDKKRYLKLCLLSLALGGASALAMPIILNFTAQSNALIGSHYIWLTWLAGLSSTIFGPIAIFMAIYQMVKPAIYLRFISAVLFLTASHYFNSAAATPLLAIALALGFFCMQFIERGLLFCIAFYKLQTFKRRPNA